MGLIAPWGEGKTTVAEWVAAQAEKDGHIPVWYKPWMAKTDIRQLHRDLLAYSEKDERHRGSYKTASNSVAAFDAAGKQIGIVFETA
ncbi:MAG: hypothetical protein V1721_05445, partial [Pseudomonadota bacterium]